MLTSCELLCITSTALTYLFSRHQSSAWLCSVSAVIVSITVILYKGTAQFSVCSWRHMLHQIEMCKFVGRIYDFPLPLLRVNLNWHVSYNVLRWCTITCTYKANTLTKFDIFCVFDLAIRQPFLLYGSLSDTLLSVSSPVRFVKRHHCPATSPVVQFIHWHTTVLQLSCCPVLSVTSLSGNQSCCPIRLVTPLSCNCPVVRFFQWHSVRQRVLLSSSFIGTPQSCNCHIRFFQWHYCPATSPVVQFI
jgi:hypothetical protein